MISFSTALLCSSAWAGDFKPNPVAERFQISHRMVKHGPDGPPPDDGYEFEEDAGGGNFFGKLGLTLLVAAVVSGGVYLASDGETSESAANAALYLGGAGAAFFTIELAF